MNANYISKIALSFILCAAVLAGCKSEEPVPSPDKPIVNVLEFPRVNSFQEIDTQGKGDWEVTDYPEWAAPMETTGDASTPINLFVETNSEDDDRSATIRVKFADENVSEYSILQHGTISDTDNGTELSKKDLKLTYGVGYSTNVFGSSQTEKYNVNATTPLNFTKLYKELKDAGESDAMVDEERYFSRIESVTGSSTSAIANQLSINAGIEVGISAFKLSVEGGYSKSSNSDERYEYALEEIQHVVGSRQLRSGMLKYFAENNINIFQSTFNSYREALANNPADTKTMDAILTLYGTHIITQGTLGGELKLSMHMKVTDQSAGSNIHAALGLGSKVINVDGEFNMSNQEKSIASNTTISLVSYGGENVYTIAPGATFESFQKTVKDKSRLDRWVEKIKNKEQLALIDMETLPIYELMPTKASRDALRNYIIGPYQTKMYSTPDNPYSGPDLYVLSGFNNEVDYENECSVTIPEIDMEVVACRMKIKELSEDEYSTVIYSGNIGEVGRERGFFIGSSTRKPCKFKRDRSGKFTTEEFDLLETQELTELYLDATGDITIYPKSATDLYRTITMGDWRYSMVDLSQYLSGEKLKEIVIERPTVLWCKGQDDKFRYVNVTVNPGAELVLNNIRLIGSIMCTGDAHIIVPENSRNIILGSDQAIAVGSKGTKLTLDGSGYLRAQGNWVGVGTPKDKDGGDLDINIGELEAVGYIGIGARDGTSCGNINIFGGKITAKDMIGCDNNASCGDIFISRHIDVVYVSRRGAEYNYIGPGRVGSTCGKITIEDPSKIIEMN